MKKFEYRILHYPFELDENTREEWNELGKEGWELVGLSPYAMEVGNEKDENGNRLPGTITGSFTWVAAAFKRELIED